MTESHASARGKSVVLGKIAPQQFAVMMDRRELNGTPELAYRA